MVDFIFLYVDGLLRVVGAVVWVWGWVVCWYCLGGLLFCFDLRILGVRFRVDELGCCLFRVGCCLCGV